MIKIHENDIMRSGTKIGWITDNHFFDHTGKKIGYTTMDKVYDSYAKTLAHLSGEYIYYPGSDKSVRLEDVIKDVETPTLSNIQRVAIRIFFGN